MNSVLARVRDEYRPSVAFLPISQMVFRYEDGGVNGFCRYIDTTLLGQDFQYTAGPKEAAEWVRLLGVSTVVPYATFTLSPYGTPHELNQFAAALEQNDLEATLLPLRPLDSLELSDLDNSVSAARRRRFLRTWHRSAARVAQLDERLRQYALYRFGRRLLAGAAPSAASHHH
jgi:hypothetical protein